MMILSNARDFLGFEVSSPNSLPRPEVRLPTSRASHSSHRCSIVSSHQPQSLQSVGAESSTIACHLLSAGSCPVLNITSVTLSSFVSSSSSALRASAYTSLSLGCVNWALLLGPSWRQPPWLPGRLQLSPVPARSPSLPSRQLAHSRVAHSGRGPTQA